MDGIAHYFILCVYLNTFRGEINVGLFQTLIQMKIRQKIRATATHPELLGKEIHNKDS